MTQLRDHRHQVVAGGGVDATSIAWQPNLIDWRASRGRADRRAKVDDETLEICAYCECEVDVSPQPHKPDCRGIGLPRVNSAEIVSKPAPAKKLVPARREPEGLDLLERMDAGLPVADDDEDPPELDVDEPALEEVAVEPVPQPVPATSSSPAARGADREGPVARSGEAARPASSSNLGPAQQDVLEFLASGPKRLTEVARHRGVIDATAWGTLAKLKDLGLVVSPKRGMYALASVSEREPREEDQTQRTRPLAPAPLIGAVSRSETAVAHAVLAAGRAFVETLERELLAALEDEAA